VQGGVPTEPETSHAVVPTAGGAAGQPVGAVPVLLLDELDELDEEVAAPPWLDDVLVPPPVPVVVPEPWMTAPEPQWTRRKQVGTKVEVRRRRFMRTA
jgi:hypothetical protein